MTYHDPDDRAAMLLNAKTARRDAAYARIAKVLRNGARLSAATSITIWAEYRKRIHTGQPPGWFVCWSGASEGCARVGLSRSGTKPSIPVLVRKARRNGMPSGAALSYAGVRTALRKPALDATSPAL